MNRQERRNRDRVRRRAKKAGFTLIENKDAPVPDLGESSIADLCGGFNFILDQMHRQGYEVMDFDCKDRLLHGVQIIGNKVYFLATGDGE